MVCGMNDKIVIGDRIIGPGHPPYIICELSANHNGRIKRALHLIDAAAATGADAIKIQTYTPDTLTIAPPIRPEFRIPWWVVGRLYACANSTVRPIRHMNGIPCSCGAQKSVV